VGVQRVPLPLVRAVARRAAEVEGEGVKVPTNAQALAWIRRKLGLAPDTPMFHGGGPTIAGTLHVLCSDAHGMQAYIRAYKCDDKQGEIARLTVEVRELRARLESPMPSLNLYTIYDSPRDFPGEFICRRFEIICDGAERMPVAREMVARGPTLQAVRDQLPPGLYRLGRDVTDEPQIVETWV
jgi:hypothetical protein